MKNYILAVILSAVSFGFMSTVSFAQSAPVGDTDPGIANETVCTNLSNNLRLGARDRYTNGEVTLLQEFLAERGYLEAEPTGYFGNATYKAVVKFQGASGLLRSGYVGPLTRAAIKSVSCDGMTLPTNTSTTSSRPVITSISKTSGMAGETITVYGRNLNSGLYISWKEGAVNFTFNPTSLSSDGTWFTFTVPAINPGSYEVSANRRGDNAAYDVINTVRFTITSSTTIDPQTDSVIAEPVLSSASPVSQYVVGGSTFGIATFTLKTISSNYSATVRELRFNDITDNTFESVTVEGVTAPVIAGTATVTGLAIPITSSGRDISVRVKTAGFMNSTSGGSLSQSIREAKIKLAYVEAATPSGRVINKETFATSNAMTVVGSKPTVIVTSTGSNITLGSEGKVGEIVVQADANGKIKINSFKLLLSTSGILSPSFSAGRVAVDGAPVAGASFTLDDSTKGTVTFANGYEILPGQSKTFSMYAVVQGTDTRAIEKSVFSRISPEAFSWQDVLGNTSLPGHLIYMFPTNSFRAVVSSSSTATPTVSVTNASASAVTFTHTNVPVNSQAIIVNKTTGERVGYASTMISAGGSGTSAMLNLSLAPGTYAVRLINYSTLAQLAESAPFTIDQTFPPLTSTRPTITSITPTSVSSGQQVTIYGAGFNATSVVWYYQNGATVGGSQIVGTNLSVSGNGTMITFLPLNFPAGTYMIKVRNIIPGGATYESNSANLTITTNATSNSTAYRNFLAGTQADCNVLIASSGFLQPAGYSCSLGGGCSVSGLPPSSSNPTANPNTWGACIPSSEAVSSSSVAPTITLSSDTAVDYGRTATLSWSVAPSTGVTCVAAGGNLNAGQPIQMTGSWTTPNLYTTTQYGMKCTNTASGLSTTKYVTVTVNQGTAPSITLSPDTTTTYGGKTTIAWSVTPSTNVSCFSAGGNLANGTTIGATGSWTTPNLYATTQYGIRCMNMSNGLSTTKYVTVTVPAQTADSTSASAPTITLSPDTAVDYGQTATISWNVTPSAGVSCVSAGGNLAAGTIIGTTGSWTTPNLYTTTQYGMRCTNSAGLVSYKYMTVTVNQGTAPSIRLSADSTIPYGSKTTLSWTVSPSTGVTCVSAGGNLAAGTIIGTTGSWTTPNLYATTQYAMRCTSNANGLSTTKYVTVTVSPQTTTADTTTTTTSTTSDWCAAQDPSKYYTDECCTTNGGLQRCGTVNRSSDSCLALDASQYLTTQCCTTLTGVQRCGTRTSMTSSGMQFAMTSAGTVLGSSAQCVNLPYNMHRGHESYAVTRLQEFLKSMNFLGEVTGFYGDKTVAAVKNYQESRGLPATGMVYDYTRGAIKSDSCN